MESDIPRLADQRPRHVAIIMDGNNRWARQHGLPGISGHKAGVNAVRSVVETCAREGVEVLTLFAFSSENWRRPIDEVHALMRLFVFALKREVRKLHREGIRLRIIGDRRAFSRQIQRLMASAESLTADNTGMTVVVAANYGGRWDIAQAARELAVAVEQGTLSAAGITEQSLQQHLCLAEFPAPDLCIRTGGEQRISNFLIWQLAYAEYYFSPVYWPDFREPEMLAALEDYARRTRRFGQTNEQVEALQQQVKVARSSMMAAPGTGRRA